MDWCTIWNSVVLVGNVLYLSMCPLMRSLLLRTVFDNKAFELSSYA